ncbi:fumarylacetoacetate hydrolase family protein [Legionella nagasakiensis]|uniref:fumarylacetoacetate hydrolase family protein n=1 Tax=Legionella nagasakiensis TaxID=535290 RepID=UPI0013EF843B|nr:fumarylacetoacetate hydrolase family protein [Legionella nagasakiensis]
MKLLRYGASGQEKAGLLDDQGNIRDLSELLGDIDTSSLAFIKERLILTNIHTLPLVAKDVPIAAPIKQPGKIMCIGYNSLLHTQQMGASPLPESEMMVFLKPSCAISGPYDPILYTRHTKKLDWEAELGVVIGKKGKYLETDQAEEHIFGFLCVNDLSDRYWQFETADKQYTKGKGMDGFASIGPYLVSLDEVPDSTNLNVKLWVNGEVRQDFNTKDYINNAASVVSYLSQFFTLFPGDIIAMGSAPGNAKFWGEQYLKIGDKVTLEIEGLGKQEKHVIKE